MGSKVHSSKVGCDGQVSPSAKPMLQPKEYADAIHAHSRLGNVDSLYPGLNFANLARFLQQPFENALKSYQNIHTQANDAYFAFAVRYVYATDGLQSVKSFQHPDDFTEASVAPAQSDKTHTVLFLRGLPSSLWLVVIGSIHRVDPEFFQRHLDFWSSIGRVNYFAIPSLFSTSSNMIELVYFSIGQNRKRTPKEMESVRQASLKSLSRYTHILITKMENAVALGSSVVRRFDLLDENHFALEQRISIYLGRNGNARETIVWLDSGKDLEEHPTGPWTEFTDRRDVNHPVFYPTIQILRNAALKSHQMSLKEVSPRADSSRDFSQSSALLCSEYGKSLEEKLVATNQFYALHELFRFCAFSYAQYLNIVESKLDEETALYAYFADIEDQSHTLHRQRMLEVHADRLRGTISAIERHGGFNESLSTERTMDSLQGQAARSLLADYQHLLVRTEKMSVQCQAQMTLLMNQAMIAESRKAIKQAEEVTKLTRLAFVFVPLGFTASICGMNLWPFIDHGPLLWVWFAISIPFLLLSFLLMSFDMRELWKGLLRLKS